MNTYGKNFDFSCFSVSSDDKLTARRKNGFYRAVSLVALVDKEIKEIAEIRFYGTPSRNYACFWLTSPLTGYGQTGGSAGGHGYDREEAALSEAAGKQGITGEWFNAVNLMEALAEYLGLDVYKVVEHFA